MKRQIATVLYATILLLAVSSHATAQQKTIKACQDEWRANREQNQANGITQKSYVDSCRAGAAAAAPAPTPPQTVPPSASPPAASPAPARRADPRPPAQASPGGGNQFMTEAQAKARCPADTVVWANIPSRIYHFAGTHNYGNTKSGAYMCEGDTVAAGYRAPKNEKHP